MGNTYSQVFPPTAKFTETEVPDQTGKVFIVTGSSSGVGKELAQILYSQNALLPERQAFPSSKGALEYLHLDLDDLSTIKGSADEFSSKEKRLDVLWNNAGVMVPPQGSKTKQGYELQLGTSCIGPFLFTKFLIPVLKSSAINNTPGSTRVVWVSSSAAEALSPKGGIDIANLDYKTDHLPWNKYGVSKAGNIYHGKEFARRYSSDGIIRVALNPGNLRIYPSYTDSRAYTELFAGLSPDVTSEHNGAWIIPWGRFGTLRADIEAGSETEEEGGTGVAKKFWERSEEQVKSYL
ncbi:hypothetical protein VTL71DRAFT_14450 [Oculimacula yallundae]|uniref:Short-chain dehydrogenase n=1 Tax=Oculimacula yallundae TaxID=86028 RepID=A0ABR4CJU8_9HELO